MLAALSWSLTVTTSSVIRYTAHDYSTSINIVYDHDDATTFPAVTICNLNQWQKNAWGDATLEMLTALYDDDQDNRDAYDWDQYYKKTVLSVENQFINLTHMALTPRGALPIKFMLLECTWNEASTCTGQDFIKVLTDFGVCYTFDNENGKRVITKPGIESGLTMTLDIDHEQYIAGESQSAGVKVGNVA